jgi:hypothetical protein
MKLSKSKICPKVGVHGKGYFMKKPVMNGQVFPVEFSADGKRNAYSHSCSVVGHSKNFAVCRHLVNERASGRLEVLYADCSAAIGKKTCPALSMIAEEKEANVAIYFAERVKSMGESLINAATKMIGVSVSQPLPETKPNNKVNITKSLMIDTTSFAEVISNVAKTGEIKVSHAPTQNESLVERAKRLLKERKEREVA